MICLAVEQIHICEDNIRNGPDYEGAWLGYMDWLEELHDLIHLEDQK